MSTPDKATEIKAFLAAIAAFFTALWGWLGWAVLILVICMGLDWITGSWAARRKGEWSSSVARDGLWHKLGEIVALLVAALCDIAIKVILNSTAAPILQGWDYGNYLTLLVALWYIFTELGSIVENAGELGAPIPGWLRKGIATLKHKADAADPITDHPPDEEKKDTE
jgi:toxin secretion/phage lysis holin